MKVKRYCPDGEEYGCGECKVIEIELSTADLIAELEKRRPDCCKCKAPMPCINETCVWFFMPGIVDKFKAK